VSVHQVLKLEPCYRVRVSIEGWIDDVYWKLRKMGSKCPEDPIVYAASESAGNFKPVRQITEEEFTRLARLITGL
jgi:hypothetical protein